MKRSNLTSGQISLIEKLVWTEVIAADKRYSVELAKDDDDNTIVEHLRHERDALRDLAACLVKEWHDVATLERAAYRVALRQIGVI